MKSIKHNSAGFTLVELLVSIAILTLLMLAVTMYFRSGNTSVQVRSAANKLSDALRTAQNYAQAGVLVNGKVPAAFGVRLQTLEGVSTVTMYADTSSPANYRYDPGEEYPNPGPSTVILDVLSISGKRSGTTIAYALVDGLPTMGMDIAFTTPTASTRFNGTQTGGQAVIALQKDAIIKTVTVDRVTGRIQSQF